MKRLTILRHAKSSWEDREPRRFRPAAERARAGRRRGAWAARSSERRHALRLRAREPGGAGARDDRRRAASITSSTAPIHFEPRIYMARVADLARADRATCRTNDRGVLLVGHNTRAGAAGRQACDATTTTACAGASRRNSRPRRWRRSSSDRSWKDVQPERGELVELIYRRARTRLRARRQPVAQRDQPEHVDPTGPMQARPSAAVAAASRRRMAASTRALLVAQQLLHAADGIAFLVEQAVDAPRELDVGGPVIAAVAGALHRPQLREARFPIAQDMLGDAKLLRQFADRLEERRDLSLRPPPTLSPSRSGRA